MKKLISIPVIAAVVLTGTLGSCTKKTTTPTTPTTTTSSTTTPTPAVGSVDGVLVSLRLDVVTVTMGIPVSISNENATASFYTATGGTTMADAGAVSVNSIALAKQSNNTYYKTSGVGMTPADLDFNSNNSNWSVAGAGGVAGFTYNHSVSFPDFTGTVPDSIARASSLTVSLSGKVSNADSVILFIAAGSSSVYRTVSGSATSVTIPASELSALPVVTNKTAIVEVVPYRVTMSTQGGKNYAFIKEYAAVKMVNIN